MFSVGQIQEEILKSRLLLAKTTRLRESNAIFRTSVQTPELRSIAISQREDTEPEIDIALNDAQRAYLYSEENSMCNNKLMLADCLNMLKTEKHRALYEFGTRLERCSDELKHTHGILEEEVERRRELLEIAQTLQEELEVAIGRLKKATESDNLVENHCELVEIELERELADYISSNNFENAKLELIDVMSQATRLPMNSTALMAGLTNTKSNTSMLFESVFAEISQRIANTEFPKILSEYLVVERNISVISIYEEISKELHSEYMPSVLEKQILNLLSMTTEEECLRELLLQLEIDGKLTSEEVRTVRNPSEQNIKFDSAYFQKLLITYDVALHKEEYFAESNLDERALMLKRRILVFKNAQMDGPAVEVFDALEYILDELNQLLICCVCERALTTIREDGNDLENPAIQLPESVEVQRPPLQREIDVRESVRLLEELKEHEFSEAANALLRNAGRLTEVEDSLALVTEPDEFADEFLVSAIPHAEASIKMFSTPSIAELGRRLRIESSRNIESEMGDFNRYRSRCEMEFMDESRKRAVGFRCRAESALERLYATELHERDVIRLGDIEQMLLEAK